MAFLCSSNLPTMEKRNGSCSIRCPPTASATNGPRIELATCFWITPRSTDCRVTCIPCVGGFTKEGELLSLGRAEEFLHLTRYVPGRPYALDLQRIASSEELSDFDENRAVALADYLADIHARKKPDPVLYRRRIRDLLGHGEGIMGMMDGYPPDFAPASPRH